MDCGDAGGEPAFSAEKTRNRSQKERNRDWGELWTHFFFLKKLYWSVANFQCCFKFSCTTVWLSYTHKKVHIFLFFHVIYHWILNSFLCSTVGLCCFSFLCFPNSQSSTHRTLPHGNLISWPSGFGWTLIFPAAEKTPWYLAKEGNKTKNCAGSGYWGESPVRAHADWCVSLTPPGF